MSVVGWVPQRADIDAKSLFLFHTAIQVHEA